LALPSLLTLTFIMIPAAIATAIAVKAPVTFTLISFLPALPMVSMLAVEVAGLGEFCSSYGEKASLRDYARLILGTPFYQLVLGYAAARAFAREALGAREWEKTAHFGLHLVPTDEEGSATDGEHSNASTARPRPEALAGATESSSLVGWPAP
jgi:hypothetical protein